ncbi:hypothetical protein QL093DRAFT_2370490 [Fusarium oxysporum]|nr:hypothetical protein QL093DRAFT_2370490 [Fusarium oxysporum]
MTPRPSRLTISQIETLAQYAGDDQSSSWGTASLSPLSRSSSNPSSYKFVRQIRSRKRSSSFCADLPD